MKSEVIHGMRLFYDPQEQETAGLVGAAMGKSAALLSRRWGLGTPADCRVYVMTSWPRFLFHAAPWAWKVYLALIFPLLYWSARATWSFAGGWTLSFGQRRVVGVKPARLVQLADRRIGQQIYVPGIDGGDKVQANTCHELAHAFTAHLGLPGWLNEGLAFLAMEDYLERRIVREETRATLAHRDTPAPGEPRETPRTRRQRVLLDQCVLGYWLARCMDETRPELLKALLAERMSQKALEEKIAAAFAKDRENFWKEIGAELETYFSPSPA